MANKLKSTGTNKEFRYHNPVAVNVMLAGDFTDWAEHAVAMKQERAGEWKATVSLLPGRHEYRFIVDGQWADDPTCQERVTNPFGGDNSVCTVGHRAPSPNVPLRLH
jgi:1,4-alpha-glucan branching enzyme